jgi:hypothetical protein
MRSRISQRPIRTRSTARADTAPARVAPGLGERRQADPAPVAGARQLRPRLQGPLDGDGGGFPEGAGVVLYSLKKPGQPLARDNIGGLLATVVVRDGRFISGYVGLDFLLCGKNGGDPDAYPDGTAIDIVAVVGIDFDPAFNIALPRDGIALARATFTVDSRRPLPLTQRCFAETLLSRRGSSTITGSPTATWRGTGCRSARR